MRKMNWFCHKQEYEEKIEMAEANIGDAIKACDRTKTVYERLCNEKNELVLALQSGGSAVQDIIDKTMRIEGMKNDLQKQLNDVENRIRGEEDQISNLDAQGSKVRADGEKLKGEVKTMESQMEACEEDQISNLDSQGSKVRSD